MDFWQTQLNFATWCATTGCGISVHDHLNGRYDFAPQSALLSKSIFRCHVYYQTRRILHQIRATLPTDETWNAFNNAYDHTAYQTISNEFGVDTQRRHSDWRTTRGTQWLANGPGSNMDRFGVHPQSYPKQSVDANSGFVDFMLDQSQGFTHAGVERLNDSIRTYVWTILGAQDKERTPILGSGTAITAQKRFLTNVEAAIQQAEETPVTKYQSVFQYARGKLDFVIGEQLYMCPSDMTLTLLSAHISGYNNEIFVATKDMAPLQNSELNAKKLPLTLASSTDKPSIVTSSHASQRGESQTEKPADAQKLLTQASVVEELEHPSHGSTKTLLTVAAIGSAIIYYLWR